MILNCRFLEGCLADFATETVKEKSHCVHFIVAQIKIETALIVHELDRTKGQYTIFNLL